MCPAPSDIRATLDDGRAVVQHVDAGLVAYRAVGTAGLDPHAITNVGGSTSHHFVVELLGPSAVATAQPIEHNGRGRTEMLSADGG